MPMISLKTLASAIALTALMASTACGSTDNPLGAEKKVVFEVTGPAKADVTFGIGTDQSQELDSALPWKKELSTKDTTVITVLLAQSKGTGEIACKITIDGKVVKENKSSGEFAVVTCSNG
jgi:hypothetical protein